MRQKTQDEAAEEAPAPAPAPAKPPPPPPAVSVRDAVVVVHVQVPGGTLSGGTRLRIKDAAGMVPLAEQTRSKYEWACIEGLSKVFGAVQVLEK